MPASAWRSRPESERRVLPQPRGSGGAAGARETTAESGCSGQPPPSPGPRPPAAAAAAAAERSASQENKLSLDLDVMRPLDLQNKKGIFLAQGSNPGLLHCRRILYHLRHHCKDQSLSWKHQCSQLRGASLGPPFGSTAKAGGEVRSAVTPATGTWCSRSKIC
ncbi:hypothetical protein ABFV05_015704 [Capra hircus]